MQKLRKPLSILLSLILILSVFTIIPVTTANAEEMGWHPVLLSSVSNGDTVIVTMVLGDGSVYGLSNANGDSTNPSAATFTALSNTENTQEKLLGSAEDLAACTWTVGLSGTTFTFTDSSNKMLYCVSNTNTGLHVGDVESEELDRAQFTVVEGYLKNRATSRYLGVYNKQDWRSYTNSGTNFGGQYVQFWKYLEDSGTYVIPEETEPDPSPWVEVSLADVADGDEVIFTSTKNGNTAYGLYNATNTSSAPAVIEFTVVNSEPKVLAVAGEAYFETSTWTVGRDGDTLTFTNSSGGMLYCNDGNNNNRIRVGTNDNTAFTVADGYLKNTNTSHYLGVYLDEWQWRGYTTINSNISGQTLQFWKNSEATPDPCAEGHEWDTTDTEVEWTWTPSSGEDPGTNNITAVATVHCTNCSATLDINGVVEYSYVDDPGCTSIGYTHYIATAQCGGTTLSNPKAYVLPAMGHNLSSVSEVPAACTAAGSTAHWHCSRCGKDFSDSNGENEIANTATPAIGHNLWRHPATAATCFEEGNTEYWSCDRCSKYFSDENGTTEIAENSWVIPAAATYAQTSYIDKNGIEQTVNAIVLDGGVQSEYYNYSSTYFFGKEGQTTWCVVQGDIEYDDSLTTHIRIKGDVNLIIADGASLTADYISTPYRDEARSLTVYGQTNQSGTLTVGTVDRFYQFDALNIYGATNIFGIVRNVAGIDVARGALEVSGDVSCDNLSVSGDSRFSADDVEVYGPVSFSGGVVDITGTLTFEGRLSFALTQSSDSVTVARYDAEYGASAVIANALTHTNGSDTYTQSDNDSLFWDISYGTFNERTVTLSERDITYIDEDGQERTVTATRFVPGQSSYPDNIYFAEGTVNSGALQFDHNISLILCDDSELNITHNDQAGNAVTCSFQEAGTGSERYTELTIYGQKKQNGELNINLTTTDTTQSTFGILCGAYAQHGGKVNININSAKPQMSNAIRAYSYNVPSVSTHKSTGAIIVTRGVLSAYSANTGALLAYNKGYVDISGGQVTANGIEGGQGITLGCKTADDFITSTGYNGNSVGVTVADGVTLKDEEENTYSGAISSVSSIAGKRLTLASRKYFTGHSITLDGSIGLNFYVDLTADQAKNATVAFSYTVNGKEKTADPVNMSTARFVSGKGFKATCSVCAPEMADTITATLSIGEEVIDTNRYSVMEYANEIIENENHQFSETLVTLAQTMLNYGAATQVEFADEHPNDVCGIANAGINYDITSLTEGELSELSNYLKPGKDAINSALDGSGLSYYGYTMLLYSKTTLRLYFVKASPTADISKLSLGGNTAENYNDYYAYVEVDNIAANDLDRAYTFSYNGNSLGSYSPMNYVYDVLTNTPDNTTLCNTVTAMYRYNKAAIAYFSQNNG